MPGLCWGVSVRVKIPAKARQFAQMGLDARVAASPSHRCCLTTQEAGAAGVGSGIARARDILHKETVDALQVNSFFQRHQKNYDAAVKRAKKAGVSLEAAAPREKSIQMWWVWGGDPMKAAAKKRTSLL